MTKTKITPRVNANDMTPAILYYLDLLWEQGARQLPIASPYKTIFHMVYPDVQFKSFYAKVMKKAFVEWEMKNGKVIDTILPTLRKKMRKDAWGATWASVFTAEEQEAAIAAMPESEISSPIEFYQYIITLLQRPHETTVKCREMMADPERKENNAKVDAMIDDLNKRIEQYRNTAPMREAQPA